MKLDFERIVRRCAELDAYKKIEIDCETARVIIQFRAIDDDRILETVDAEKFRDAKDRS